MKVRGEEHGGGLCSKCIVCAYGKVKMSPTFKNLQESYKMGGLGEGSKKDG